MIIRFSGLLILFALQLLPLKAVFAQKSGEDAEKSIFDLMHHDEVVKVELETDLLQLLENRRTDEYQSAKFTFHPEKGPKKTLEIQLRNRGRFRRSFCILPPLKLKFAKEDLRQLNLSKHNELKLVTNCLNTSEGEEMLLREYLVYQLYAALYPVHYRVQLVRIRYVDPVNGIKLNQYAVLMEDEKELAARFNSKLCEDCFSPPKESFNQENLQVAGLFQYLIGNTDWSIPMLRNVKLLQGKETGQNQLVPFDFDFSGFVNAPYAIPDPRLRLSHVRQRYFLGMAEQEEEIRPALELFRSKEQRLLGIIDRFTLLHKSSRQDLKNFVLSFFQGLDHKAILTVNTDLK